MIYFNAHIINCVCHSIGTMFIVPEIYNFKIFANFHHDSLSHNILKAKSIWKAWYEIYFFLHFFFQMDSKSSPLAMLAKTCSQIGADPIAPSSSSNKTGSNLKKNSPDLQYRNRNSPGISNLSHGSSSLSDSKSCNLDSTDTNTRSPNSTHNNKSRSRSSSTEIRVTDSMTVNNSSRKPGRDSNPGPGASPTLLKINSHSSNPVPPVNSTRPLPSSVGSYPSTTVGSSGVSTNMSNPTSATSAAALLNNPFLASFASSLQSTPESIPGSATGSGAGSGSVCRDPLCRDPHPLQNPYHQQIQNNFTYSSLLQTSSYYKEAMMAFTLQQRMAALAAAPPPGAAPGGTLPHVCNWVAGKFIL